MSIHLAGGVWMCVALLGLAVGGAAASDSPIPGRSGERPKQAGQRAPRQKAPADRAGRKPQPNVPPPDVRDFHYGEAARQVFDLWQAKSAVPTPLVLFIHGGGFRGGDKQAVSRELLAQCLKAGVSYAAINYRLTDEVPFPQTHLDCARALQTLRHNAGKWGLDPKRVASTGGSAGAGISMWLAFHDDLAEPDSKDPVARQSTRLTCVAVSNGQCSYDHRFNKSIGLPGFEKHPFFLPFYGIQADEIDSPRQKALAKEAAAITHISAGDAPAWLDYNVPNEPVTEKTSLGAIVHHPTFGVVLKKKMDALGIECVVQWPGHPKEGRIPAFDFLRKHFGMAGKDASDK
ncbi:MAG TPA: alpha/beta hydrolase [Phycisphaerae bacterium]|nr:alpha/beta hydrolase [Phycisphaerae bacterium]